jgi:hypothetical protein
VAVRPAELSSCRHRVAASDSAGKIARPGHRVNSDRTIRVRGIGWEVARVGVDDATRLAYVEVLADEKAATAAGFLRRAIAFSPATAIAPSSTLSRARRSGSVTCARAPTGRARTGRQSGSSAP